MSACEQELFPGTFQPTPAHFFMKLLHDKGLLLRCFTQNIDSLENQAGLPKQDIVAAHGNFDSKLLSLQMIMAILCRHSFLMIMATWYIRLACTYPKSCACMTQDRSRPVIMPAA